MEIDKFLYKKNIEIQINRRRPAYLSDRPYGSTFQFFFFFVCHSAESKDAYVLYFFCSMSGRDRHSHRKHVSREYDQGAHKKKIEPNENK